VIPIVLGRLIPAAAALLLTLTPIVNDLCARRCEQPVDTRCPQHAPSPESPCTHDHSLMSAALPRVASPASTPLLLATVPVALNDGSRRDALQCQPSGLQYSPPRTTAVPIPLRI
jgi:hypothetical protein